MADQQTLSADSAILRQTAQKVDASSSELNNQVRQFQTLIEGLSSSWSSDVKDKFFQNYNIDLKALQEMVSQYAEVAAGLLEIADEMDKMEEENNSVIKQSGSKM